MLSFEVLAALFAIGLAAGFVDASVGGGGLIQIPGLLVVMGGVPLPTLLGTNKDCLCDRDTLGCKSVSRS